MFKRILKQSPLLSYCVRMFRISRLKRSKPRVGSNGFPFVGYGNMLTGDFERVEFQYFKNAIVAADIFVNVGANIGYYVSAALFLNKPVIAFEPDINNFSLLETNVKISANPDKCLLLNMGVGSKWDRLKIFHAATGSSFIKGWANNSRFFYNEVGIVTLDDFNWESYNSLLFLVDVEGFESEVVLGASEIIKGEVSQTWIIEIMTNDEYIIDKSISNRQLELLSVFKENRFQLFYLTEDGELEIRFSDLEECIKLRKADYGHNFIFKKVHNG